MRAHRRTVLLVDDHPLFRHGFVAAWRRERPNDVVLEAGSAEEALEIVERREITMLVADLRLPGANGLALCQLVRSRSPASATVVLTTYDAPAIVAASRAVGARGFFGKDAAIGDLVREIDRLMESDAARSFPEIQAVPQLTSRERQVLGLLLIGESNPAIAAALGISVETIKTHVAAIFDALGVENRFQAVDTARALGLDVALPHLGDADSDS